MLNDFGFYYKIVGNGKLAIERLQTNIFDVVLMDDYISKPINENLLYSKIVEPVKKTP